METQSETIDRVFNGLYGDTLPSHVTKGPASVTDSEE